MWCAGRALRVRQLSCSNGRLGDEGEELVQLVYREFLYCISYSYHNSRCNYGTNPLCL